MGCIAYMPGRTRIARQADQVATRIEQTTTQTYRDRVVITRPNHDHLSAMLP